MLAGGPRFPANEFDDGKDLMGGAMSAASGSLPPEEFVEVVNDADLGGGAIRAASGSYGASTSALLEEVAPN